MEEFKEDLYCFHLPNLGPKVGNISMKVAQKCLSSRLVDEQTYDNRSQRGFYREVVKELVRLVA